MSRKDTYRSYGIWIALILFYVIFYYLSNHAWVDEIDIDFKNRTSSSQLQSMGMAQDTHSSYALTYIDLKPDTNIAPKQPSQKWKGRSKTMNTKRQIYSKRKIYINKADQKEWESLYNIGPYRAGRIINFRKSLGGFYSVDQVGETYGLPDSVFQEIKSQLLVDSLYDHIKINEIAYDSLYPHPYITKQMAYFIVKHRESEHVFRRIEDLFTVIREKDYERLRKLEPYLDFDIE